ncbi:MAG: hypothetical protein WC679_01590 [Bacteroidales bacterium]|jgi:hypothetical protein
MTFICTIKNGDSFPLGGIKIKRVWTILVPNFTIKDEPIHTVNAFLEDRWHDWYVSNDTFHSTFHSSALGETHNLLIEEVD